MQPRIIAWDKLQGRWDDPVNLGKIQGALQHFMSEPSANPEIKAALQHFGSTGDFPASVLSVLEKYGLEPTYDNGWESVFDVRDMTGEPRNGFEIRDVEDGLTFSQVAPGAPANIYKMSGTKTTVTFAMYGGGLGWSRLLFDDRDYWTLEDNARAFRNKWAYSKSQIFYALIEAIPASENVAWQAVTPAGVTTANENYLAIRDMNTINAACQRNVLDLQGKGYGVNVSTPMVLLRPMQLTTRLNRALGVLNASISGGFQGVGFNVTPVTTMMLTDPTKYYIIVPKLKIKAGNRMNLTIFTRFDELTYTDVAVGWGRFGGAIADVQQFKRCATA